VRVTGLAVGWPSILCRLSASRAAVSRAGCAARRCVLAAGGGLQ